MEQLSMFESNHNMEEFFNIIHKCRRSTIQNVTDYLLSQTDFFSAPASTRFHGAEPGGLLTHSLAVYYRLCELAPISVPSDSIIITALFHDICKANFYTESTRNVKGKDGKWTEVPYYKVDERFPYGSHGGKSVYLLLKCGLELTEEEAIAINNHMGGWDVTAYHNPSEAFLRYPLALFLHIADLIATNYDHK